MMKITFRKHYNGGHGRRLMARNRPAVVAVYTHRSLPGQANRRKQRVMEDIMGEAPTYARIYATPDGNSHFEDVTVAMGALEANTSTPTSQASAPIPVTDLNFRRMEAGADSDWHGAPRRQFVIILQGVVEVTASDGEVRRFGPASMFLADDMDGKHRTRPVDGDALIVTAPLRE
jgi:hypothetical protein